MSRLADSGTTHLPKNSLAIGSTMNKEKKLPICYYHDDCLDGWAAALAIYAALDGLVDLVPAVYNVTKPDLSDGGDVYIVDFSFPAKDLIGLIRTKDNVVLFDHHKTAEPLINEAVKWAKENNYDNFIVYFDQTKSGALLTWEYAVKWRKLVATIPEWVKHVSDRDLWQFKLPETKLVCSALRVLGFGKIDEHWLALIHPNVDQEMLIKVLAQQGEIVEKTEVCIQRSIERTAIPISLTFGGETYVVPFVFCPKSLHSETLHNLSKSLPFAVSAIVERDEYVYSFRSQKGSGLNIDAICKALGGGGHENAAGCRVKINGKAAPLALQEKIAELGL